MNLLSTLTEPNGAKTTFTYDKAGRRTSTAYPNGVTQTITYDASGRQTQIKATDRAGTVLTDFTYSYINPATRKDTALRYRATAIGATMDYAYDALDRLVDARTSNARRFQYSYDGNGNRLSQTVGGTTTNYSYDAANRLTAGGGLTYSYDNNGNLTGASNGRSLTYNAKNQTTGIKPPGLLSASVAMTYAGSTQDERTKAGNTTFTRGFGGVTIASEPGFLGLGSSNTYYTRDDRGNLVSQRLPSGTYYYLFDGLGSVVALTDVNGGVANRYLYDPYGNTIPAGTTGSVANPWTFAVGFYDAVTGRYKFGTRYYDPSIGRWTQVDPELGEPAYVYADSNPVNFVDPDGDIPALAAVAAGAIIRAAGPRVATASVAGSLGRRPAGLLAEGSRRRRLVLRDRSLAELTSDTSASA
ncbi:MAG TPA: RHS repeat-associated core domain-containing protein [Acidimicrobiales bacterium]|nr:RHS repeat-associated core domain-containing protein [Acidimicrobiales bacterium]